MHQVIKEPTHILNTSPSCIDLIFMPQLNLTTDSHVHSSQQPNCHYQTIFGKLDLYILYPPPYLREIWYYRDANTGRTRPVIKEFNWERAFSNTSILSNFIPREIIVCDDKRSTLVQQ